jgi:ABC-type molybdate transport system ATPase subunit
MSVSVRLSHDFGGFALDVAFEAPAGVTALFGRSGSGKTRDQCHRRAVEATKRADPRRQSGAV